MPYQFQWHNDDKTIITVDMFGEVTWEAWHKVVEEICAVLDATPHHVDLIIRDQVGMPKGNSLPNMRTAMRKFAERENLGQVIIVSNKNISAFVRVITNVLSKLLQMQEATFVTTEEEAEAIIRKARQASV